MSPTPVTQPNTETPTWGRCLRKSWATARKWPHATILTPPWVPEEVGMYSRQASPPFNVGRRGATSTTLAPWWAMVRLPPTAKSTTEAAVNISSLRKLTWRPMRWPRTFKEYLQLCNSFMLPCDKYSTRHYLLPLLSPIQQYSGFFNAMQVFCLMSEREKKISWDFQGQRPLLVYFDARLCPSSSRWRRKYPRSNSQVVWKVGKFKSSILKLVDNSGIGIAPEC